MGNNMTLNPDDINSGKLFDLLEYENTDSKPVSFKTQLLPIYNFVRENKFKRTMEVGFGIGGSAVHILAASGGKHVAMDPVQRGVYKNLGLKNIKKLGFESNFEFFNDCSENVLPKLLYENRKFEFIYIDGDHKFDFALIDFFLSDLLLDKGGYILLDDAWMLSVKKVGEFISVNRRDYEIQHPLYPESILIKKTDIYRNEPFMNF